MPSPQVDNVFSLIQMATQGTEFIPFPWPVLMSFGSGCQAVYTVIANTTSNPSCANLTVPAQTLAVKSESALGALSPYGWVDSVRFMFNSNDSLIS